MPTCSAEQRLRFMGTAAGGPIELTIDGVNFQVITVFGENSAQVAANVVEAINTNPSLMALEIEPGSRPPSLR